MGEQKETNEKRNEEKYFTWKEKKDKKDERIFRETEKNKKQNKEKKWIIKLSRGEERESTI